MARVYTYITIMTGMMILLEIAGIQTGLNRILALVGIVISGFGTSSVSITGSSIWDILFNASSGALIIGVGVGIAASLFTRSSPENYILLPLITGIGATFIVTFANIINYTLSNSNAVIGYITLALLAPLLVGYVISLAEFFRGTD